MEVTIPHIHGRSSFAQCYSMHWGGGWRYHGINDLTVLFLIIAVCLGQAQWNIATYAARESSYTCRLCKVRGHAHQIRRLPKRWKESRSRRFDGKQRKDKRIYRSLAHKVEEITVWRVFSVCSCRACLPTTVATAPYRGWSMLATQLTFFEP